MRQVYNTVFISYRRDPAQFIARAIYQALNYQGYEVWFDVENQEPGDLRDIILRQIGARAHFLLVLTPDTLSRCIEPNDWLLTEIREAFRLKRNVVPLFANEFTFKGAEEFLPANLFDRLRNRSGIPIANEHFDSDIQKLHEKFLMVAAEVKIKPVPNADEEIVKNKKEEAAKLSEPTQNELMAERYVALSGSQVMQNDFENALHSINKALQWKSDYFLAYMNRGNIRSQQGDWLGALDDYNESVRLEPDFAYTYYNRGNVHFKLADWQNALFDYNESIRLKPDLTEAYLNRGQIFSKLGDIKNAFDSCNVALQLNPQITLQTMLPIFLQGYDAEPDNPYHLVILAATYHGLGDFHQAKRLLKKAIRRDENYRDVDKVVNSFIWMPALGEEARKLMAKL